MEKYQSMATLDRALPIGFGQTISQPSLVLDMTKALKLTAKCKVLEIGTGSGYQTCLLAEFSEAVYTVECIEDLSITAEKRLRDMGYENISFLHNDGSIGWTDKGPFDRIMVTAAASEPPAELIQQLAPEGIMIIPVGNSSIQYITEITKNKQGHIFSKKLYAVRFVPLVGKYSI